MIEKRIVVYFKQKPLAHKWYLVDQHLKLLIKFLIRRKVKSSLTMVFENLLKGFKLIGTNYHVNLPFNELKVNDQLIVLGTGEHVLEGYQKKNKIVAGIGLMTHPANLPNLFKDYPISVYLQHSDWTAAIYNKWYGEGSCKIWPSGIDTEFWSPETPKQEKKYLLLYEKFLFDKTKGRESLLDPIVKEIESRSIPYRIITYGEYNLAEYKHILSKSIGMIFLCEHESQGLAYQEAMAMDVPILAWNQGIWLDPNRISWGEKDPVPASSVPYFNEQCGLTFKDLNGFKEVFDKFYANANKGSYHPRAFVLANLTLEKSAERMTEILADVYK